MQGGTHDDNHIAQTYHADTQAQQERLSAYLDGALDSGQQSELERHLATCADCQRDLAGLRRVRALLRALPTPALPRSFTLPETGHETERDTAQEAARDLPPARRGPTPVPVRRASAQWRRTAQWAGSVAAVIGLLLLLGSVLPGMQSAVTMNSHTASGGASSSPYSPVNSPSTSSPTYDQAHTPTGVTAAGRQTPTTAAGATATTAGAANTSPTPTHALAPSTPNARATRSSAQNGNSGAAFPFVPVGGATLLVGGVALVTAGRLSGRSRRRRRRG